MALTAKLAYEEGGHGAIFRPGERTQQHVPPQNILQGLAEIMPPVESYTINVYGTGAIEASVCRRRGWNNGNSKICARGATMAYWATVRRR